MNEIATKQNIVNTLSQFSRGSLRENGIALLNSLGYQSEREILLLPNTYEGLVDMHPPFSKMNRDKALIDDWRSVDILFQLTGDDIRNTAQGRFLFDDVHRVDNQIVESYLFIAIHLKQNDYSRSKLAGMAREFNRFSAMPVMILFQYGDCLTLAIIRRRLNKKDETKEVLEKVTLIKDIRFLRPHRAHVEILSDFHLESLHDDFRVNNFIQLANAWERRLGTYDLTERFYRDIANWYFATFQDPRIVYPRSVDTKDEEKTKEQRSMFLIRLLTRLIFCWFLQEKGLIPGEVFSYQKAAELLKDANPTSGTYYRAILQNLFFATLNQVQGERKFRSKTTKPSGRDGNRGAFQFYRYEDLFNHSEDLLSLLKEVPFLNGGLFECLDTVYKKEENKPNLRFDDFSEEKDNGLFIPNDIFFGKEHTVDLSKVYDDVRKRREKTRGLIDILDSYKFTIEENTPLEEEIALDPELLGKVFENLLASYNEDTKTTARKSTGSFYTPREIVAYMVDETLLTYLAEQVPDVGEENIRALLAPSDAHSDLPLSDSQKEALIRAIENVRVLDPACGSGAFPMGMLQRLVSLLSKLDPNNITFKQQRLLKAQRDLQRAEAMEDETIREAASKDSQERIKDIQHSFDDRYHELDFARKLYLIEDCIYGVDIQPVAVQIAKLRFFITLIVDQKTDRNAPNQGVRPLPNLETKLVAANSLLPLAHSAQLGFGDYTVDRLREQLRQVRHDYFRAKDPTRKAECRAKDAELRKQISEALQNTGWPPASAEKLAAWDPYDPNTHADFFEPKWMFGGQTRNLRPQSGTLLGSFSFVNETAGQMEISADRQPASEDWLFDIVLGNPPYVKGTQIKSQKPLLKPIYDCYDGDADLYVYFYERGIRLLRPGGQFSYITSNKWLKSSYGKGLRNFLLRNSKLRFVIDFGDEPIFTAIAYPCIVILSKQDKTSGVIGNGKINVLNWQKGWNTDKIAEIVLERSISLPQEELSSGSWQIAGESERKLLEHLERSERLLGSYVSDRLYRGITTGFNQAYIIDRNLRNRLLSLDGSASELIKPVLRGKDVKRWQVNYSDRYLIKIESSENKHHPWTGKTKIEAEKIFSEVYPSIFEYFQTFRNELSTRYDKGTYYWELRACSFWDEFEKPKLYFPSITNGVNFAFDETDRYYGNNKTNILVPPDVYFTIAVLNSSAMWWLVRQRFQTKQGGFFEFLPNTIAQLPIPSATQHEKVQIRKVVECILALARAGKTEQVYRSHFESLLNGFVYGLFFPEEFEKANLSPFELLGSSDLPDISSLNEQDQLPALHTAYERLFLGDHPLRSALFSLRAFDFVRIIEEETNIDIEVAPDETEED